MLTGNINKTAELIEPEKKHDNFFHKLLSQFSDIIPINKMLLFPLPEFKLYYSGP